ncbi:zinc transporter foi [Drosophila sulfurigaster albostrigata]|uniref:zinc transporter foi n=1 Tax=Drosophila sulfurigaster albostrigata TaxID=89887 RepID=UPI002D21A78A|nr:zinc transporter foi [Drosophila sulfurigaster albostrigata]XP_062136323.1 zinc transporter foi [Drosophila sulfurigaster albostrigata]
MARHIMAVCVVCLLCAQRLHCQDHIEDLLATQRTEEQLNARLIYGTLNPSSEITTDQRQLADEDDTQNYSTSPPYRRHKRHAGHEHEHGQSAAHKHVPQITEYFLQQLMPQQVLNASSFQSLLQQLGLQQLINSNGTCVAAEHLVHHVQPHRPGHHSETAAEQPLLLTNCTLSPNGTNTNVACAPLDIATETTTATPKAPHYELNEQDLLHLCPVLLHGLTSNSGGCIEPAVLAEIDTTELEQKGDILYVWIYAFLTVFACGLLGLVGVAIIPFMGSRYYKHIIQYLVSLAVGTMTGDALLHLLPHSLAGQDEHGMIMKGLGCLGGIIFFYVTEHALTMISEWRKSVEKKETKKPSRAKVMRDPDSSVNNSVAGDKMCKQKYSSYPYCYDEITMNNKQDVWMHLPDEGTPSAAIAAAAAAGAGGDAASGECSNRRCDKAADNEGSSEAAAAAQSLLSTSHNNYAEMNNHHHNHNHNNHQQQHQHHQDSSNTVTTELDSNTTTTANGGKDKNDHVTVILREHESSHHGHSHRHGHVHSPPDTLSAVAWMIIMGDGLHNFTDGMAIGAAFAENIAGGFSTSLAVFCHELPHELGDFAILMKAGMSVKSAVYYNLLTGVLSFIGMIFGIVFGQSQDVAKWMFAVAAGLFIYIALVDMMPEISAAHKSLTQFMLQILGMLSGVVIMLLIALYEGQLMNAFGTGPAGAAHHQHVH